MRRIVRILVVLGLTALGLSLVYFQGSSRWYKRDTIPPSPKEIERRLGEIERVFNALPDDNSDVATSIAEIFSGMAKEENERTRALQQRASSLLSATTLVISIILASIGLMLRNLKREAGGTGIFIRSCFVYSILLVFGVSLYWTWVSLGTRPFVSFDPENLLSNMSTTGADLVTAQIVATQQNYQVIKKNSALNTEKARALEWATEDLFSGLLLFSVFCLFSLWQINKLAQGKEGAMKSGNAENPKTGSSTKAAARPPVKPSKPRPAPQAVEPTEEPRDKNSD